MAKRAREPFAFQTADGIVVVHPADLYADDHPYVLAQPAMFRDALEGVIEAATAAPGEVRRGPGRPRREP